MDIDRRNTVFKKGGNKLKGKCYNCGKEGHFASSCFTKSTNKFIQKKPTSKWQKKGFKRKQVIPDSESENSEEEEVDQEQTTDNKDFQ